MPVFEGENLKSWVFRAKRFFSVHHLTKAEKLNVVAISFKGEVMAWYLWEDQRR